MEETPYHGILAAWEELETALRDALPACSLAPPTQPAELLSALRIEHRIGPEEEEEIMILRGIRNRVAHQPVEPSPEEAARFQARVQVLLERLEGPPRAC